MASSIYTEIIPTDTTAILVAKKMGIQKKKSLKHCSYS